MGMYTGLRCKVRIKKVYQKAIKWLHFEPTPLKFNRWEDVNSKFYIPGLNEWILGFSRYNFIPFGALCYMPEDFSISEDEESFSFFDSENGFWEFCCSLKNYNYEIEWFIKNILVKIVDEVDYCESLYEEYPYEEGKSWKDYVIDWKPYLLENKV